MGKHASKSGENAVEPTRPKSGRMAKPTDKGKQLIEESSKTKERRDSSSKSKKKKEKKKAQDLEKQKQKEKRKDSEKVREPEKKRPRQEEVSEDDGHSASSESSQSDDDVEATKKRKRKSKDKNRQDKDANTDDDSPVELSESSSEAGEEGNGLGDVDEIDSLGAATRRRDVEEDLGQQSDGGMGAGDVDMSELRRERGRESSITHEARELEAARMLEEETRSSRSYGGLSFPQTSSRASSIHTSITDLDDEDARSTTTRSSAPQTSTTRSSTPAAGGRTERKRSRLKDYEGKTKRVIAASTTRFKAYLCTKEPYVSGADEFRLADAAYNDTKDAMNFAEEVDDSKRQTIMHGAANIRSAVKDKVRTWVASTYKFQHMLEINEESTDADIQENAKRKRENEERHALLTKDRNYTYAVFDDKTSDRSHPFQHKFVGNVIQDQFFTNMQSPGIVCEDCFNPISAEMIAMIYSMVKFCIDEWQSGVYAKGKFNSAVYKKEYEQILVDVQAFESSDDTKEIIMTLRKRLFTNARARCGIVYKPENTVKVTTVKAADISKMAQDGLLDD